jgi:ATP-dependent Clp protease ATP-binding subunit ClpX
MSQATSAVDETLYTSVPPAAAPSAKLPSPIAIKRRLDAYVIDQDDAKTTLAIAVRLHYARFLRRNAPDAQVDEFNKPNTLLIGGTGSGKTHVVRTLARIINVPFVDKDTTSITEAGYVGGNVEDVLQQLWIRSGYNLELAQWGVVYFDEFDKIRSQESAGSKDVSGEGVQRGMLTLLGGAKTRISTKGCGKQMDVDYIDFDTTNVLFICGGAFVGLDEIIARRKRSGKSSIGFGANVNGKQALTPDDSHQLLLEATDDDLKKFGLIPELIGRLPVRTALRPLDKYALRRILTEPRNSLVAQVKDQLTGDVALDFSEPALMAMAEEAAATSTGARALERILWEVMKPINLLLPDAHTVAVVDVVNRAQKTKEALAQIAEGGDDDSVEFALPSMRTDTQGSESTALVSTTSMPKGSENTPMQGTVIANNPPVTQMWEVWKRGGYSRYMRLMHDDSTGERFYFVRRTFDLACKCGRTTRNLSWEWQVKYEKGLDPLEAIGEPWLHWHCACGQKWRTQGTLSGSEWTVND